jgi:2-dehydro-3-deoxygalactonokinase
MPGGCRKGKDNNVKPGTAVIGIDWGTSQLRAFRIDAHGQILESRESAQGIAAIRDGQFDQALRALIADWQTESRSISILLCGMIGSRQGWHEIPYSACPANARDLVQNWKRIDTGCGTGHIVGGVSCMTDEMPDIMRGEETLIVGAAAQSGTQLVIAPGTHSKWAVVHDGRIASFRTYMTGEVYDLLRKHSSLGWLMRNADDSAEDDDAFRLGVRKGLGDPDLLHVLFGARTRGIFENIAPAALAFYLSGILIGSEISGGLRHSGKNPVIVIAAQKLGRLYEIALNMAHVSDVALVDAREAAARGLWRLWKLHGEMM